MMTSALQVPLAIGFDWDLLFPIVVFVFWVLSRFLQKADPGSEENGDNAQEADSAAERARQIQEEIRRRIARQQGAPQGDSTEGGGASHPLPESPPSGMPGYPPVRPFVLSVPEEPGDITVAQQLEDQMRRLQESQAAAERQRRLAERAAQAAASTPANLGLEAFRISTASAYAQHVRGNPWRMRLRDRLSTPAAAREAVVLQEILGRPKGFS